MTATDLPSTVSPETRATLARWAAERGCRLLVLFGSAASGGGRTDSDVDLAIDIDPLPGPRERLALIGELQDRVDPRRADLVFLRPETDPVLRFEVFRTGVPLHEAEDGLFVREVVRALALYEDAIPFRRALERKVVGGDRTP